MRIIYWFLLIFCLSCQKESTVLPVSVEQAAAVMLDVHTAENAALGLYGARRDSFMLMYYDQICAIHEIDSTTLGMLLGVVRNNPDVSEKIYQEARRQFDEQYPDGR